MNLQKLVPTDAKKSSDDQEPDGIQQNNQYTLIKVIKNPLKENNNNKNQDRKINTDNNSEELNYNFSDVSSKSSKENSGITIRRQKSKFAPAQQYN